MWMYLVSLNCRVNMLKIAHFQHKTFTTVKKKVKKHVFVCIMVYEGFFWKILLQLLPINKQRPKSICLCKTGTKFLRMKLHLVLSGHLKDACFSCFQLPLTRKDRQRKQMKTSAPTLWGNGRGLQSRMQQIWEVSREGWLHVHPFRNGWEGRLLTEGV